jgi:GR25 family glycosyltransferase involved in LPS biosynthesis
MRPAFIIHSKSCSERASLVADLVTKTGAIVVEAEMLANPVEGCFKSHLKVAALAKDLYPNESYLVFEDDCVLRHGWETFLNQSECLQGDLVYLGYTDMCEKTIFGTHGMLISPRFRDSVLSHWQDHVHAVQFHWAADWVLPRMATVFQMEVIRPLHYDREKYCYQMKGLRSQITGKLRH